VQALSERLKKGSLAEARKLGRTILYLASSQTDKEALARGIVTEQKIRIGPACVDLREALSKLRGVPQPEDEDTGIGLAAAEMPFSLPLLYLSGVQFHERAHSNLVSLPAASLPKRGGWLRRQMEGAGLKYMREDNCFHWIEDFERVQQLLDEQVKIPWPKSLDAIADQLHPFRGELFTDYPASY
jgi:hypothetical protein